MPSETLLIIVPELNVTAPGGLIIEHARRLLTRGLSVRILTSGGRLVHEARGFDIPVDVRPLPRPSFLNALSLRQLAREMRRAHTRFVHAHGIEVAPLAALIAGKCGCPWVLELQSAPPQHHSQTDSSALARVLVPSEELRARMVHEFGVPKALLKVLRPGINVDALRPRPRDPYARLPVVGSFGPFLPEARHELLIRAVAALSPSAGPVQLLLVGDGPERHRLWRLARELGILDRVIFSLDQPSRRMLYDIMDVYVDASPKDAITHDLYDAMARGIPPIACRAGSVYEVIDDGVSGRVAADTTPQALAEALNEVLSGTDEARRELGSAARQRIRDAFPAQAHLRGCLEAYEAAFETLSEPEESLDRRGSRAFLNPLITRAAG